MNKEEILKKAQSENKDEGEEFVKYKSSYWGSCGLLLISLALLVFNLCQKQPLYNQSIMSLVFAYVAFEALGRFFTVKDKASIVTAVLSIVMCVFHLVRHINGIMG